MSVNQRQHFRIQYPAKDFAKLELQGNMFKVVDLSQSGLKFESSDHFPLVGQIFLMTLHMLNGHKVSLKMQVVRVDEPYVMMVFEQALDKFYIEEEKSYLEKHHGKFSSAGVY